MSVKVYSGYLLEERDIGALSRRIAEFRRALVAPTRIFVAAYLAQAAVKTVDRAFATGVAGPQEDPLQAAWTEYNEDRANSDRGYRHPRTDSGFVVAVNEFEGRLYALLGTERREWTPIFRGIVPCTEYFYWDNTDRDEEVGESEWEERRRVWLGIDAQSRRRRGGKADREFDCGARFVLPSSGEVLAQVPAFERRLAQRVGTEGLDHYFFKVAGLTSATPMQEAIHAVIEAGDWLAGPEGEAFKSGASGRLAGLLPEEITMDMLYGRFDPAPQALDRPAR